MSLLDHPQIAQYHEEIRSHYAQSNPGGNLLGKGMLGVGVADVGEGRGEVAPGPSSGGCITVTVTHKHILGLYL